MISRELMIKLAKKIVAVQAMKNGLDCENCCVNNAGYVSASGAFICYRCVEAVDRPIVGIPKFFAQAFLDAIG